MADVLDAELLALAGDDSSSDEGEASPPNISASPRPSSSHQRETDSTSDMARRGTAIIKKKPRRRVVRRDESEEEGEASSVESSTKSQSSAPMSESDSDGSAPASTLDALPPPYSYEKLFESAKEKAEIMILPELKRESVLAERREEYDRFTQNQALRRLHAARVAEEAAQEKKKRKAGAAGLEENQRKSSRQKTAIGGRKIGETSDAIENYKRQREEKSTRDAQRKLLSPTKTKDRDHRASPYSDVDADGESDVEWDDGKDVAARRSTIQVKNDEPMEYKDVSNVVISRFDLTEYCFYPTFETAIVGTFVRGLVGMMPSPTPTDPNHHEQDYRVGQVSGVAKGPYYAFETKAGKRYVTNQYVVTKDNGKTRQFPFIHISRDIKVTTREYARWRADLDTFSIKPPMKSSASKTVERMTTLTHYSFRSDEIDVKIALQDSLRKKAIEPNPKIVAKLKEQRDLAYDEGDMEEVERIAEEIHNTKPITLAFGTFLFPPTTQRDNVDPITGERKLTEGERIAALNARNRKANTENVRRAQLAELRAKKATEAAVARGEEVVDHFARIKTRPKTNFDSKTSKSNHLAVPKDDLFEGSGTDISRAGTPMSGTSTPKNISTPKMLPQRTATPLNGVKKPSGMSRGPVGDDDIIGAMDFELDPEVQAVLGL